MFTVIDSSLYGFITNKHDDQLPVGSLAQLVEYCTIYNWLISILSLCKIWKVKSFTRDLVALSLLARWTGDRKVRVQVLVQSIVVTRTRLSFSLFSLRAEWKFLSGKTASINSKKWSYPFYREASSSYQREIYRKLWATWKLFWIKDASYSARYSYITERFIKMD